jgi:uncharacterized protein (TIGR02147 family)
MAATSIFEHLSYRTFLNAHLQESKKKNQAFSLRAYAQKLAVTPSYLSEILSGKKNLSLTRAVAIAGLLELDKREQEYFLSLVEVEDSKNKKAHGALKGRVDNFYKPLPRNLAEVFQYRMLSEWYVIPVLEILTTQDFAGTNDDVAKILGISPMQVDEAVNILTQLQVIAKSAGNLWRRTDKHVMLASDSHNKALKKFHSTMLEKTQRALYDQTPQERYTGSETLMVDPAQLPEAQAIINECLDRLVLLFVQSQNRTEPYHLLFNMISLKRKTTGEK